MKQRSGITDALAFLGIAQRAGAVVKGTDAVRQSLRRGEVFLLILAEDSAETQRNKLVPLAEARSVTTLGLASREELGRALGAGPLAAVGVTQKQLAEKLEERIGLD